MVAGQLADSWGRRHAMLFCTYSFAAGGLLLTFAPNIICLALARTILGFSSG
jgi:predicted MFS family arabinose efflux permease